MPKGGKGANTAPILDDADVLIDHLGAFSYQAVAFDPDAQEKLSYSFLVDGKQKQTFTTDDGVTFKIDKQTGQVSTASLIPYMPPRFYTLTIAVEDRFKAIDLGTVRLTFPPCTEYSIDIGSVFGSDPPVLVDAGTDAFCFTTQVSADTFVEISSFTDNDEIIVSGVDSVSELSFTSGVGADATDLIIVRNNTATGTLDSIVLKDVLVNPGVVFDYATAVAAVGYHFITIDPCTPVSIDVGTLAGPPVVFDASDDEYCFSDNANVTTDVVINGFSSNDKIEVSNATAATYSFTTGTGADSSDLIITFNNLPTSFNQIVLDNVITNPGTVSNYATAVAAVGFDFMTFA